MVSLRFGYSDGNYSPIVYSSGYIKDTTKTLTLHGLNALVKSTDVFLLNEQDSDSRYILTFTNFRAEGGSFVLTIDGVDYGIPIQDDNVDLDPIVRC